MILDLYEDGENHDDEEFTVSQLMDLLTGGMDCEGQRVLDETPVFINDPDDDGNECFYRPLDIHFPINWKRGLVVIPTA